MATSMREMSKLEESDEDLFMVPDIEAKGATRDLLGENESKNDPREGENRKMGSGDANAPVSQKRGRNPIDKEYRRIKRLLRNRVSAQQARERKKEYVSDLELKATELQDYNSELEEKISTLANENSMLRKILMNTRSKPDECDVKA